MTESQTARLYHRAIKSRWEIPDDIKGDVIAELHNLAISGIEESSRIAACRALLMAESQNQRDEISKQSEFAERVLELAARFGIDIGNGGGCQASSGKAIGSAARASANSG